jgi:hypothetical protein
MSNRRLPLLSDPGPTSGIPQDAAARIVELQDQLDTPRARIADLETELDTPTEASSERRWQHRGCPPPVPMTVPMMVPISVTCAGVVRTPAR